MSRHQETMAAAYFDALFSADPDPWRFRTSGYEQDKYRVTLGALLRDTYETAIEVGCANGVFTRLLAARCRSLTALDASPVALDLAREACVGLPNVDFALGAIPAAFLAGPFDLIVVSEVLYYLTAADVGLFARLCADRLDPGGEIVLCHWLGETDYPLTGEEAADLFAHEAGHLGLVAERLCNDTYRLERLRRPEPPAKVGEKPLGTPDLDGQVGRP